MLSRFLIATQCFKRKMRFNNLHNSFYDYIYIIYLLMYLYNLSSNKVKTFSLKFLFNISSLPLK